MNDHRQWYLKIKYLPSIFACLNQRRASVFASLTNKHQTKTTERQQQNKTRPTGSRVACLPHRPSMPVKRRHRSWRATHGEQASRGPLAQGRIWSIAALPIITGFPTPGPPPHVHLSRGQGCHSLSGPIAASRLGSDGAREGPGGTSECGYCGAIGRRCLSSLVRCFWY